MSRKIALLLLPSLTAIWCVASVAREQEQPVLSSRELAQGVFDRYVSALGGREAYGKVFTRSIKGTFEYDGILVRSPGSFEQQHAVGSLEIYWKSPNKLAQVLLGRPLGGVKRGYDGREAWGFHPQAGVRKISPAELTEIFRESVLYQPLALRESYAEMSYEGKRKLDGPVVDIISATTKENRTEKFYFDSSTGLPVRLDLWEEGPEDTRAGGEYYLAQFYLGDYRTVDGIQVPFSIRRVRPHSTMSFTFTEVKQNIAIDDSIFGPPERKRDQ